MTSVRELRRRLDQLVESHPPGSTEPRDFLAAQFDLGLAWIQFPAGLGGLGLDPRDQLVVDEILASAGAPSCSERNPIGHGMAGPTLISHGTTAQQQRFLRPLFTGEEIWCQLFSEPGAGSDVAGLSTRAERDGDDWVLNGQKVWTSLAHVASYGMLLARSDPDVPKHRGLTYFLLDMNAQGVDVRPLRQMTGDAEFNEVYLTDVRLSDACRVGDVGQGWSVGIATLMNERVAIARPEHSTGSGAIAKVVRLFHERAASARLDELMRLWIDAEVHRLTTVRARAMLNRGTPGPEGSIPKLIGTELNRRLWEFAIDLLGAEGLVGVTYEMARPTNLLEGTEDVRKAFLRSRANTIEGGTSEIMRNILAERVLGLPGDLRDDRTAPWREIPRS
jgi:alkylation response protein AidB-like acyl-CoA dehydrogenase